MRRSSPELKKTPEVSPSQESEGNHGNESSFMLSIKESNSGSKKQDINT